MRSLPAVSDGCAVFGSNYSIVGVSRNVCLALLSFFQEAVEPTVGQPGIRRSRHPAERVKLPLQSIIKDSLTSPCLYREGGSGVVGVVVR